MWHAHAKSYCTHIFLLLFLQMKKILIKRNNHDICEILHTGVICSGMLVDGSLKKPFFVVIASFQGVNIPSVADFKLLMGHH